MGLGYGSILAPQELTAEEVGAFTKIIEQVKTNSWGITFLRWFTRIVSVVAFFINPLAGVAVGALATAEEAMLDVAENGKVNIGTVVAGAINAVGFGLAGRLASTGASLFARTIAEIGTLSLSNVATEAGNYLQFGQKPSATEIGIDWGIGVGLPLLGSARQFRKLGQLKTKQIITLDVSQIDGSIAKRAINEVEGLSLNQTGDVLIGTRNQMEKIKQEIKEFTETSKNLQSMVSTDAMGVIDNIGETIKQKLLSLEILNPIEIDAVIETLLRTNVTNDADAIKLLTGVLGKDRAIEVASAITSKIRQINEQVKATLVQQAEKNNKVWSVVNHKTAILAHKTHEYVKMITPTELAEMLAKKFSNKVNKQLSKAFKSFRKVATKTRQLEKIYEETGGTTIDSEVILGYKVIFNYGFENLIQLSFRPTAFNVKDPTAKNFGGKKPVYIRATASQLHKLKTDGFTYYLEDWAMSRGGRAVGDSFLGGVLGQSEMFMSLLPLESLREIIRLSSLVKRNYKYFADAKTWGSRFSSDFKESWKVVLKRTVPRIIPTGTLASATQPVIRRALGQMLKGEYNINDLALSTSGAVRKGSMRNAKFKQSAREHKMVQRHAVQMRRLGKGTYTIFK